ncbi:unnamed protein product [Ectocarpus sp. 12 AP-2014]
MGALALSHAVADAAPSANLEAPTQVNLDRKKTFKKSGHSLTAVAAFEIEAKILSKKEYRDGRESNIAPVDLALGWGAMASEQLLSKLSVTQQGRFASISYSSDDVISRNEIIQNSSNMHMVPISRDVKKALLSVKPGQVVQIKGYLVNIRHTDGWRWRTSTTRTDEGNGACEIILVQSIEISG